MKRDAQGLPILAPRPTIEFTEADLQNPKVLSYLIMGTPPGETLDVLLELADALMKQKRG